MPLPTTAASKASTKGTEMSGKDFLKTRVYSYKTYEEAKEKFEWGQAWELFDGNEHNLYQEQIEK